MNPINVPTNDSPSIDLLSTVSVKKKDVKTKTSKPKRTWRDKRRKVAKKGDKKKKNGSKEQETAKKGGNKNEKEAAVQETAAVQNIYPSTSLSMEEISEPYIAINTFSQILTGAIIDDVIADF